MAQPIPIFHGEVNTRGQLDFDTAEMRTRWAYLKTLSGKRVDVIVRVHRKDRSLEQNNWIWGVAYPIIAESLGYDEHEHEDVHYALVEKCFGSHFDKRLGAMVPNKRSSKLSTTEFSTYMSWLVRFAATDLGGIVVPLPGESEAA